MAKICPKCSADTEPLDEESKTFCIHEKLGIVGLTILLVVSALFGTGVI